MQHLTKEEKERLLATARENERDYLMVLLAVNHGLRASEVVGEAGLDSSNFKDGYLTVQRLKGSKKTTHPLLGEEKELVEKRIKEVGAGKLFPISRVWFWYKMKKYGEKAGIPWHKATTKVLKHTTAKLALQNGMKIDDLQQYMGHVNMNSTAAYLKSDDEEASKAFALAMGMLQ